MIIITSTLNAPETVAILNHLQNFNHSKILIIDITGAVLNNQNEFYRNLNTHQTKWHSNNLFVLTILSEKFKRFLNKTFANEYKKMYDESTLRLYDSFTTVTSQLHALHDGGARTTASATTTTTKSPLPIGNAIINWIKDNTGVAGDGDVRRLRQRRLSRLITSEDVANATIDNSNQTDSFSNGQQDNDYMNDATVDASHEQFQRDIEKFLHKNCGDSCQNVVRTKSNCEKYFMMVQSFNRTNDMELLCEYLVNQQATHADGDGTIKRRERRRRWTAPPPVTMTTSNSTAPMNQTDETAFGAYFGLFDFLATSMAAELGNSGHNATVNSTGTYDFIVLDFKLTTNTLNESTFVWRPLLILQQNQLNQHLFYTHPLLPGYHHWLLDNSTRFWNCGLICWILAGIICLLLICIVMASVTVGIAVRYDISLFSYSFFSRCCWYL